MRETFGQILLAVILLLAFVGLMCTLVMARDNEVWEANPPEVRQWYRGLMQPDYPTSPCCGESDAYWADSFAVDGDQYVAIITDTRPDEPLGRPHIEPGTRVVVPNHKLKYDQGNPTGHGVIFIAPNNQMHVYCYVVPGGV